MSDYKTDALQVHENAVALASEKVSDIEANCIQKPVTFLIENYKNKKIRERDTEPNFKILLGIMLAKIAALAGVKDEITDFDKQDIVKMFFGRYSDLTLEELWKAFENERYSIYCEKTPHFNLFNASYISDILVKYKKWRHELRMAHNIVAPVSNQLAQNSTASEREIMNTGIIRRFEQFKNGEKIETPLIGIYDDMFHRYLFPKDTDYAMFYKIAKRDIISEMKNLPPKSKDDFREAKAVIADLMTEKVDDNGKTILDGKVLARAKLYVLEHYFQKLIDDRIDINQILK